MLRERLLAKFDQAISELFRLESWHLGNTEGEHVSIYYPSIGKDRVGIVGANGEIHTVMGRRCVRHYYDVTNRLTKRILVRNDLKSGERLATQEEVDAYLEEQRAIFAKCGAGLLICF